MSLTLLRKDRRLLGWRTSDCRYGARNASSPADFTVPSETVLRLPPENLIHASYFAGREPGGVTAAVVKVTDACSLSGRYSASQFMKASAARAWDAATTATLAPARFLERDFATQPPGSRYSSRQDAGMWDINWWHFEIFFVLWAG